MTVTKRRGSWFGSTAGDVDEYLLAFAAGGYPVQRIVHPACGVCGSTDGFAVRLDDEAGVAVRRCSSCAAEHVMLDGSEYIDDAHLGEAACPCGHEQFDMAVGYSMTDLDDVRWVSVGLRCQKDGLLGVYVDWKIDYSPSAQLLGMA